MRTNDDLDVGSFFLGLLLATIVTMFAGMLFDSCDPPVSNLGGKGEACYPNKTCEADLTCYHLDEDDDRCGITPSTGKGKMTGRGHDGAPWHYWDANDERHDFPTAIECAAAKEEAHENPSKPSPITACAPSGPLAPAR